MAPHWLKSLASKFSEEGYQLYIVGGALRDQLMKLDPKEWDLASNAKPDEIEKLLRQCATKQIGTIGKKYGTITAILSGEIVEVTTFRSEIYTVDSRHPEVRWGKTIQEDLSRRDFTINAFAYDLIQDQLLDPHNGQLDLAEKVIRAVGEASDRFEEDPLRMLRAIRFATTLNFTIEPKTLKAISDQKERFAILSAERIASEMDKILLSTKPSQGIRYLVETGLIAYILPELIPTIDLEFDPREHKDIFEHILQVLDATPPKLELRWGALLHDISKPITRRKEGGEYSFHGHENAGAKTTKTVLTRLRYPNELVHYISKLVRLHQRLPNNTGDWSDGAVRRFVRDADETLDDLFTFASADTTSSNEKKKARYQQMRDELWQRIEKLNKEAEIAKIKSPLSGEELMEMFHRSAGPWIKPIKEELLRMVLDGELQEEDKNTAKKIAQDLAKD